MSLPFDGLENMLPLTKTKSMAKYSTKLNTSIVRWIKLPTVTGNLLRWLKDHTSILKFLSIMKDGAFGMDLRNSIAWPKTFFMTVSMLPRSSNSELFPTIYSLTLVSTLIRWTLSTGMPRDDLWKPFHQANAGGAPNMAPKTVVSANPSLLGNYKTLQLALAVELQKTHPTFSTALLSKHKILGMKTS
jgi:hypothetical protein